jgi:hypothetical protein
LKPPTLPKFPVAGTNVTAKAIAQMPVNELMDVFKASGLKATQLLRNMKAQEPGILDELADEVREFFENVLEEQQQKTPGTAEIAQKWQVEIAKKARNMDKRSRDMLVYLQQRQKGLSQLGLRDGQAGKPGRLPGTAPGKL